MGPVSAYRQQLSPTGYAAILNGTVGPAYRVVHREDWVHNPYDVRSPPDSHCSDGH